MDELRRRLERTGPYVSQRAMLGGGLAATTAIGGTTSAAIRHLRSGAPSESAGKADESSQEATKGNTGDPGQEFRVTATVGELEVAPGESIGIRRTGLTGVTHATT